VEKNMSKYKHLTLFEREKIYLWKNQDKSFREIGRRLGRCHKTISNEWKVGRKYLREYSPSRVHEEALKRKLKQRQKAPLKNTKTLVFVKEKLEEGWSPEIIAGRLPIEHPGESIHFETIYSYIYGRGREFKLWTHLDRKHKKRRSKGGRKNKSNKASSRIPNAVSIEIRPKMVDKRNQVGHYETDLMEGNKKDKSVISINIERKTRHVKLSKLPNKKSKSKLNSMSKNLKMIQSLSKSSKPLVKSVTYDNGSENVIHTKISRKFDIKGYFCHAYHSWEKGSVENRIIQVRKFIPKGESISKYSDKEIQNIENWINNRPMKCLNFLTPNEAMEKEANKYKFRKYLKELYS
jgi:IS30 family transposase